MSNPRCNYAARRFMAFITFYYDTLVMLHYSVCRSVCLTVQSHSFTVSDSETSYFFTLYNSPAILQFSYTEYYGKIPTAHILLVGLCQQVVISEMRHEVRAWLSPSYIILLNGVVVQITLNDLALRAISATANQCFMNTT